MDIRQSGPVSHSRENYLWVSERANLFKLYAFLLLVVLENILGA